MKKNIIKNSNDLIKLKESFNKAFDTQIKAKQIQERVGGLNKLGFGEIKSLFEGISDKLFDANKACVANYIKTIKENKDLKTLYILYENALKPSRVNDTNMLVSSMVSISEGINKKSLNDGLKKLQRVLKEAVIKSNITAEEFDSLLNENREINESLTYILTNKKTASNLFEHTNKVHNVISYIDENMADDNAAAEINDKTSSDLVNELNEAISCDTPWETEAIKDLTLCYLSESSSEELFNRYKEECISLLSEKIEDSDNMEEEIRLSTMKESLSKKEFDKSKLKESILTLAELKYTLINE